MEIVDKLGRVERDRDGRQFFVWDATTAIAIKRLPLSRTRSLGHIAEFLLQRGVPYIFAMHVARLPDPAHEERIPRVGVRSDAQSLDILDFIAYLDKCGKLLSMDRLRKCLRYGGIVWRLACVFLDIYAGLDAPSHNALNQPQRLIGPDKLVDDGISKAEILLLIGAVEVYGSECTFSCLIDVVY